jgi:RNA polymerase sigma-70 factor (ECF subfamily)
MANSGMADGEVMAEVRDGRLDRLALLFERHHLHLFHFFLRFLGDRSGCEDLVQEVFVRLLRYRASYRPGSPFAPWMWQIARNVLHDHRQSQRPWQPLDGLEAGLADPREGAEHAAIQDQDAEHLRLALARLAPAKRELLLLSRNPDLPYRDLALLLDCSVAAVKVQVHRALKDLKTAFSSLQGVQP